VELSLPDGTVVPLTLSGGVAAATAGEPVDAVVQRADAALYAAKGSGRNRIVTATPPEPQGGG
jgi:PleD family two-component response regulator